MADDTTPRLALPLLQPGQAQKELYHNEALALLDLATHTVVEAIGVDTPPAAPDPGQCWIVGDAPGGAWTTRAHAIAGWTAGGWRFISAREGMIVWSRPDAQPIRFESGSWRLGELRASVLNINGNQVVGPRRSPIAGPTGGTVVDAPARTTINAILTVLRAHGLIEA